MDDWETEEAFVMDCLKQACEGDECTIHELLRCMRRRDASISVRSHRTTVECILDRLEDDNRVTLCRYDRIELNE